MRRGWLAILIGCGLLAVFWADKRVDKERVVEEEVSQEGVWVFPEEQVRFDARFPRARLSRSSAHCRGSRHNLGRETRPDRPRPRW